MPGHSTSSIPGAHAYTQPRAVLARSYLYLLEMGFTLVGPEKYHVRKETAIKKMKTAFLEMPVTDTETTGSGMACRIQVTVVGQWVLYRYTDETELSETA